MNTFDNEQTNEYNEVGSDAYSIGSVHWLLFTIEQERMQRARRERQGDDEEKWYESAKGDPPL